MDHLDLFMNILPGLAAIPAYSSLCDDMSPLNVAERLILGADYSCKTGVFTQNPLRAKSPFFTNDPTVSQTISPCSLWHSLPRGTPFSALPIEIGRHVEVEN
jgi:hypothetical protein